MQPFHHQVKPPAIAFRLHESRNIALVLQGIRLQAPCVLVEVALPIIGV